MEMARGGPYNPPSECNGDRNGSELLGLTKWPGPGNYFAISVILLYQEYPKNTILMNIFGL